jgi:hypothetical protein
MASAGRDQRDQRDQRDLAIGTHARSLPAQQGVEVNQVNQVNQA